MNQYAFISRHAPTAEQHELARQLNAELILIGDKNAFDFTIADAEELAKNFAGVICVHPLIAMTCLLAEMAVGVFENANRAPVGQPPQFKPVRLVIRSGVIVADAGRQISTTAPQEAFA